MGGVKAVWRAQITRVTSNSWKEFVPVTFSTTTEEKKRRLDDERNDFKASAAITERDLAPLARRPA